MKYERHKWDLFKKIKTSDKKMKKKNDSQTRKV